MSKLSAWEKWKQENIKPPEHKTLRTAPMSRGKSWEKKPKKK